MSVLDGHAIGVRTDGELGRPDAGAIERAEEVRGLPSAPELPLVLATEPDQPQPRRQVNMGGGMTVVVGRVRRDPILDVKLVAMGHNVIRGAAGASVLNAELLVHRGLLGGP